MNRTIPGTIKDSKRKYLYILANSRKDYNRFWREKGIPDAPLPKEGGVIAENVVLTTVDGKSLYGISCGGDTDGWCVYICSMCKMLGLLVGIVQDNSYVVINDWKYELSECKAEYFDK